MPSDGYEFWTQLAKEEECRAASPANFMHVPAAFGYDSQVKEGMLVEACYPIKVSPKAIAFWIATVVRIKFGYFVCLRWLGMGENSSHDFWRNVAYHEAPQRNKPDLRVHPVGWCKKNDIKLIPPHGIELTANWKSVIENDQTANLPEDFHEIVKKENESCFERDAEVEVVDTERISALRPAKVECVIGRRIRFRYIDDTQRSVWLHEFSHLFHPVGWGRLHGRDVISTVDYWLKSLHGFDESPDNRDSVYNYKPILVPHSVLEALKSHRFEIGSKLEVVDPLRPGYISVGTIVRVLRNQFLMVAVDDASADDGSDEICEHATSPILLPAGFAAANGLEDFFCPPHRNFDYKDTKTVPKELLEHEYPKHDFRVGDFVEVVGCAGTDLIYVGRIKRIGGHLLRIGFEGYESDEDQFFPMSSPDIYPVGWCHAVGHSLITPSTRDDNHGGDNHDGRRKKTAFTSRTRRNFVPSHG